MVTIHEKNSIAFDTLGLGALLPSFCNVTEELNGLYELEMEHPYDEQGKWKHIEKERIIFASTPRGKQPFRIYHVNPDMGGVKVYARHVFYDLLDNLCLNVDATGTPQVALSAIKGSLAYAVPFTFATNLSGVGGVVLRNENPIFALLGMDDDKDSFIKAFGGEILRDCFAVNMKPSIGEDRGVAIRYGKNLVGLEISEDISEVATRIYAYGKDGVAMSGGYRDSPYINTYFNPKITVFEDSSLSAYELPSAVQKLFDGGCDLPKVNIKADFQMLSKTEEYKEYAVLEEVQLGDVVTVSNIKMGFHKKAKVISYEWDSLLERYKRVELGDFVADLTSSITSGEKSLSTAVSAKSTATTAATDAQTALDRISRKVTINNEGLYICVDTNSLDTATKVFHFGSYGLRHSSTGVNGTYKTIIDGDGNLV
ncbi:phage tail spike protein [Anaerotignum sp. MB30-C6]|uniref:phage tail spike protein n=1 Tax=Anaerotignum sp. MB30-C6 TaxID=3070814 RepID=UPI0027DD1E7F|nr:phage tail spike protein [Anaerotignum sp. MB30-C6]WMI81954.1 phage tail spike protein [Anaerotignum sp. MB30-C6]